MDDWVVFVMASRRKGIFTKAGSKYRSFVGRFWILFIFIPFTNSSNILKSNMGHSLTSIFEIKKDGTLKTMYIRLTQFTRETRNAFI